MVDKVEGVIEGAVAAISGEDQVTQAPDISTATFPDTPDVPPALRGKPLKEGIAQLISTTTEKERLMSVLQENEKIMGELRGRAAAPADELDPDEIKRKKEADFVRDPTSFLDRHFEERIRPLANTYLEQSEKLQETLAAKRLKDWEKHGARVKELIKTVQPHLRTDPATWDLAHKMARIDELDKLEAEVSARGGYHVEGNVVAAQAGEKKTALSEEEKRTAAEFGLSDEEYVKWSNPEAGAE